MAILHKSLVKEVASNKPNASTAFNLPDSAPTGYRSCHSVYATNDKLPYFATNGAAWESGIGTFTAGTPDTLARTTILESSTGSAIDFSSGGDVTVEVQWIAGLANLTSSTQLTYITNSSSASQALSAWTNTKIGALFDTVISNPYSWWDTVNKNFLPDVKGVYLICAKTLSSGGGSSEYHATRIYKNGSLYDIWSQSRVQTGTSSAQGAVALIELNGATDYVEVYTVVSAAQTLTAVPNEFSFQAILVGVL